MHALTRAWWDGANPETDRVLPSETSNLQMMISIDIVKKPRGEALFLC